MSINAIKYIAKMCQLNLRTKDHSSCSKNSECQISIKFLRIANIFPRNLREKMVINIFCLSRSDLAKMNTNV